MIFLDKRNMEIIVTDGNRIHLEVIIPGLRPTLVAVQPSQIALQLI